ncbi:MAG: transglutaminase family protein [Burkholderiales bacterium]|nr:transglutaminase family protein [Burkholderiales bacterium]
MTVLAVRHETRCEYAAPVLLSRQLLHLTPRPDLHQEVRDHRIDLSPLPAESSTASDYFGNAVLQAAITESHRVLTITAESTVRLNPRPLPRDLSAWESVRDRLAALDGPGALDATRFAHDSPYVERNAAVRAYAAPTFTAGRSLIEALLDLNARIHAEFEFDPTATSVATPLADVLRDRRGVCQDFAHLMIACLRSVGLSARYVSGYILTAPPPGMPRLVGSDASHAWVSAWCPGLPGDWLDLDPTNDCLVANEHVTLAWGRDFHDVTPTRGVIIGGGEQELQVAVTVSPLDDTGQHVPAVEPGASPIP